MKLKWVDWIATGLLLAIYLARWAMYLSNISGAQHAFGGLGYATLLMRSCSDTVRSGWETRSSRREIHPSQSCVVQTMRMLLRLDQS